MKIDKKILISVLLVLVMLCVISTASAEDTIDENLTATDNEVVVDEKLCVNDGENQLKDDDTITVDCNGEGDYTSISDAVAAASDGKTIFIKNGEYTESKINTGSKQLIFLGESQEGVILKSSVTTGFLQTSENGYLLTFSKLTFKDIAAGSYGVLNIGGNGNININDCTFNNCKSKYGAMRIFTSGMVTINNTKILNCNSTSTNGASGIELAGSGSQLWIINNLYIENSKASSNNFGVLYLNSNSHDYIIDNLTICNSTGSVLASVYSKGNVNITNSKIAYNNFTRDACGIFYCGGKDKKIIVESSIILLNNADYILTANTASTFNLNYNNIQNNSFKNNFSNNNYGIYNLNYNYWGGNEQPAGITVNNWVIEENGVFKLNDGSTLEKEIPKLTDDAEPVVSDAIYVAGDGSDENNGSENSPVYNITKAVELAKAKSGNIVIKEGTYSQNAITIDSDITIIGEGDVVIDGSNLENDNIFKITSSDVNIKNIKFKNIKNSAINIVGNSKTDLLNINVLVENCLFNNITASRGGAIYSYYTKGNLKISNSNFTNNNASGWGGAICAAQSAYDSGLNVEISNSIFANNYANNGGALYIQASTLTLTDCELYNNTAEHSPGAIYLTNITATIDNCKIYNNKALKDASAIAVYAGQINSNPTVLKASQLTITNSIIENNTGGAAVYVISSNLNISYSSIINDLNINNTVTANYDNNKPGNVSANNNWWGVNNPSTTVDGENIKIDKWVIMNIKANASEVLVGDNVKITVDFNHVNTTSGEIEDLTGGAIPKTFTVTFTSTSGSIEPLSVEITKSSSKDVIYTVGDVDGIVSAQTGDMISNLTFTKGIEPYYGIIYVSTNGDDKNNGSENYPVASLSKAVELALHPKGSGQIIINEGTYNGTDYHVTSNLTVTGLGNVILNGDNQGRLFYMAYGDSVDKLQLINLSIINVKHNFGAAVYSMAKELILDNITISTSPDCGSVIQNTGKMTLKNSLISNHNGGNVITTSGNYDLIINNTEFINNTVLSSNDYGIVYISSGKGNLYVENSKFLNSTTRQGVIVARNTDEKIYVKSSEFINNRMQDTVASGGAISVNEKLEVANSVFINNTACGDGGAINIGRWGDATITKSVFMNNAAGSGKKGDAIYNGKKLTINYCVLISNGNNKIIYHEGEDNDVNAQYNWWGTNDEPKDLIGLGTYEDDWGDDEDCVVDYSNWVIMTVSNNLTGNELDIGDEVEFIVDFTNTNTAQKLSQLIPELKVNANAVYGDLDKQQTTTENNIAKFIFTATEGGKNNLSISSSNAVNTTLITVKEPPVLEVIYLSVDGKDSNNGSRSSPVSSLIHAIEIAQKGKIVILTGNYTINQTIKLEKDIDITGEGSVIINGNKTKIFNNYANLNLTNIKFTNASALVGSIVHNQVDKKVMITSCEFYSNVATGTTGGIIYIAKGTLSLSDSKFYENSIRRGVVSAAGDTSLEILNCEFFNHSTSDQYGVIRIDGADVIIENSLFRNNSIGNGAGIYITSSKTGKTIKINNNTFIDNKATQSSMGNGGAIFVNIGSGKVDLTISNSTFIRNNATVSGGAIYTNGNNVNVKVDSCVFINNTAKDGNSIYVNNGEFTISNSVILNDGVAFNKSSSVHTSKINAANNFWGDNTKANVDSSITVSNWIIMNATYTTSEEGILTITAIFDKTNSTTGEIADYEGNLPDGFDVTFTSASGKLNEVVSVKDGKASVNYTRDTYDDNEITVKVLNAEVTIPFAVKPKVIYVSTKGNDSFDGSKDTPVLTLKHALEIAEFGQIVILEGSYKTGDLGIISKDLNITGEGKVIIDADNNNGILYVGNESKVILKNLIMINGYGVEKSGALLGNSNYLTIINCTLTNSSAGENNAGAIYNVGYLTIINSTISNNIAREGGAIFAQDSLAKGTSIIIENSIFENNTATGNDNFGGGAIFTQQIAEFNINNSTFKNNKVLTTSSGGAIFISLTTATIKITNSEFISNHANGQEDLGGGAIYMVGTSNYERKGTLSILNTLFENNTANFNGGAVYVRASTLNIANSVLINNNDANGLAIYGYQTEQISPSITLNDNWWGSNDNPSDLVGGNKKYKPTITRWTILTITNDTPITDGANVNLTVSINTYTTGTENGTLTSPIGVERDVTIRTTSGEINGILVNGEFKTTYSVPSNLKIITAHVDGEDIVLYVVATKVNLTAKNITASKGDNVDINITVLTEENEKVNTGSVEVYFGDDLITTIDVVNGYGFKNIIIGKNTGIYTITAKYIDLTGEFEGDNATATLNVTGVNNIVTPDSYVNFFDNGVLRSDVPFDELFFDGTFNDLGTLTISKSIKITGINAVFNNTVLKLTANNTVIDNITFTASKIFTNKAVIYIEALNTTISNSKITYNPLNTGDSYAVYADSADNLKLINNTVNYNAGMGDDIKTIALYVIDAKDMTVKNNTFDITVPSIGVTDYGMVPYYYSSLNSAGIVLDSCNNLTFDENNVSVKYNGFDGYDTINAVHIRFSDDIKITGNSIKINGHSYSDALHIDGCENIEISKNTITAISDNNQANALSINGKTSAVINNNTITAKGEVVVYSIYLNDALKTSTATVTNNNIYGEANVAYAIYSEENKTIISDNTIVTKGNYTIGVISHITTVEIKNNNISSNATNTGTAISPQSGAPVETLGICVSLGNATITSNNITSNGNHTIYAVNSNVSALTNELNSVLGSGKDTIKLVNSNLTYFDGKKANITMAVNVRNVTYGNVVIVEAQCSVDGDYNIAVANANYTLTVKNGAGNVTIPDLNAGDFTAVITKDESEEYNAFKKEVEFTVKKASDYTFSVEIPEVRFNSNVTVTVTIPNGKGNVSINNANKTLTDGVCRFDLAGFAVGVHEIAVIYSGDGNYVGLSKAVNVTVLSSIESADTIRGFNSPYDFKATLYNLNTTDVVVSVDGVNKTLTADGSGVITLTNLAVGTHTVVVFNPATNESAKNTVTVLSRFTNYNNLVMDYNDGSKYSVCVLGDDGNVLVNGVVTFNVNGKTLTALSNANGIASITISELPGVYHVTASYNGESVGNTVTVKQILKASKTTTNVKKSAKKFYLKATLKHSNGKAIKGKKITFKLNGKKYTAKTTSKGLAKVTIKKNVIKKLKKGKKYTVTITYLKDVVKCYVKVKK